MVSAFADACVAAAMSYIACKKCGTEVCLASELADHSTSERDIRRRQGQRVECTSHFVCSDDAFPRLVAAGEREGQEGRLLCSKCSAKLGQWTWAGLTCSCGAWVVPAFQLNQSKVDVKAKALRQDDA